MPRNYWPTPKYPCPYCKENGKTKPMLHEILSPVPGGPAGWVCIDEGGCGSVFQASFEIDLNLKKSLTVATRQNPDYQAKLPKEADIWERFAKGKELVKQGIPVFSKSYLLEATDLPRSK